MLKQAKLLVLTVARIAGFSAVLLESRWRRSRLLILGYHGFSQDDEHLWDLTLYMPPDIFRSRLECLRRDRCNVLPVAEGLLRLYDGSLPDRSVAVTIDDGTYDAYLLAAPILKEFGYPATVYLTTYYAGYQRPVFDVMSNYLLWKARDQTLHFPEVSIESVLLDVSGRATIDRRLKAHALERKLSGRDKDALLQLLADRLDLDYEGLCRRRILHIMTLEEAGELARAGFDIELHTHRHRLSRRRERLQQEISDNQHFISGVRGSPARHFCYPGGVDLPEFEEILTHCGIESAATCYPGMAVRRTPPFHLPRLMDSGCLTLTEFSGWLSGEASLLPWRKFVPTDGQLAD